MNLDYLRRFAVNQSLFAPPQWHSLHGLTGSLRFYLFRRAPTTLSRNRLLGKHASGLNNFGRYGTVPRADLRARLRRIALAQPPEEFLKCDFLQLYWRSTCQLTRRPACSGLTYSGVPTNAPTRVNIVSAVRFWDSALAIPKSIIFGRSHAIYFHD